jgi:hypothetical protein
LSARSWRAVRLRRRLPQGRVFRLRRHLPQGCVLALTFSGISTSSRIRARYSRPGKRPTKGGSLQIGFGNWVHRTHAREPSVPVYTGNCVIGTSGYRGRQSAAGSGFRHNF